MRKQAQRKISADRGDGIAWTKTGFPPARPVTFPLDLILQPSLHRNI